MANKKFKFKFETEDEELASVIQELIESYQVVNSADEGDEEPPTDGETNPPKPPK